MEGFGKHLKELRLAAKITQSGLAEKLNLHPQTVSKWERGLSEPDIAQLGDLAAALGITLVNNQAHTLQPFAFSRCIFGT